MPSHNQRKPTNIESNSIHHEVINCSTVFANSKNPVSTFCVYPLANKTDWISKTDICCWHCAHSFEEPPVYIPEKITPIDNDKHVFSVYGNFCSFPCAKAYLMEHHCFDTSKQLMLLNKIAIDSYNVIPPFMQAPPRICLKMFGGTMSITEFRQSHQKANVTCRLPPFVGSQMIIQTDLAASLNLPVVNTDDIDTPNIVPSNKDTSAQKRNSNLSKFLRT